MLESTAKMLRLFKLILLLLLLLSYAQGLPHLLHIRVCHQHPFPSQSVNVRRVHLRISKSRIIPTKIINHNEQDVGFGLIISGGPRPIWIGLAWWQLSSVRTRGSSSFCWWDRNYLMINWEALKEIFPVFDLDPLPLFKVMIVHHQCLFFPLTTRTATFLIIIEHNDQTFDHYVQ